MCELVRTLMKRDHMSREDAQELVQECRQMVADGANPEDVLHDELGLEPDYIYDLL